MASKDDVISNSEDPNRDSIKNKNNELIDESEDKGKHKEKDDSILKDSNINKEGKDSHDEVIPKKMSNRKYIPKNEQEALKAKIINLEMNEKIHENNNDFNIHNNIDNIETQPNEKFKVPPELKKTFIVTMILAVLGVALIICGCIKAISDATPGGGVMFWVLGSVVIIPGGFYSYQFYKAKKAKEGHRRQDILDNIPQL